MSFDTHMREITGHTRIFGIIADPIHHVKTPQGINAIFARRDFDGVLVPMHIDADGLPAFIAGLRRMRNFSGFIATVPHKTAMLALCDEATDNARRIGAVNAVRREADGRLVGEMLDGLGFVGGLRSVGIEPKGMSAYLAGAGGAANAIAFALAEAGVARLTIANRSREKAEDLVARIAHFLPHVWAEVGSRDPSGHDLAINATSLGLREGDALPFDADLLTPDQIAAEIIMQPQTTTMMAAAAARGCRVHPGRPMLACQLELMADFMSGQRGES